MKGVILTAGKATRLRPITFAMGKVLVPIYNKPMIFYEISLMINFGVTDIAIVCNQSDFEVYDKLLVQRYKNYGLNITLRVQRDALGTAHALRTVLDFVGKDDFVVLFGDNIFVMKDIDVLLKSAVAENEGLTIFAKEVEDARSFGVIEIKENGDVEIEEKPEHPKTNLASAGLYIFKNDAVQKIKDVKLSPRGEYELTDVVQEFIKEKRTKVKIFDKSAYWFDTGTFDSLLDCSNVVRDFENENGLFGCIELELFKNGKINKTQFEELLKGYKSNYISEIGRSLKLLKK